MPLTMISCMICTGPEKVAEGLGLQTDSYQTNLEGSTAVQTEVGQRLLRFICF
jgi:hypothetical protein